MKFSLQDARFVLSNRALLQKAGHKMKINLDDKFKEIYLKLCNVPTEFGQEEMKSVFPLRLTVNWG